MDTDPFDPIEPATDPSTDPSTDVHERRPFRVWVRELFDYRFIVSLVVLILVCTAAWGFVQRQQENNRLTAAAQSSASSVEVLTHRVDDLTAQLTAQRAEARRAAHHADQQRALLRRQNRALANALQGLLTYLTTHGIRIPQQFINELNNSISGSGGGGGSRPSKRRQSSAPPSGPGRSGTHPCAHSRKC